VTESSLWISPLLILPGVALLILSTSIRFNRLHDEVEHVASADHANESLAEGLLKRGRRFRNALISLYVAAALLAAAGLMGVVSVYSPSLVGWIPAGLTGVAVGVVVYGTTQLIHESRRSLDIIEAHVRHENFGHRGRRGPHL